jgi:hypothetical protein
MGISTRFLQGAYPLSRARQILRPPLFYSRPEPQSRQRVRHLEGRTRGIDLAKLRVVPMAISHWHRIGWATGPNCSAQSYNAGSQDLIAGLVKPDRGLMQHQPIERVGQLGRDRFGAGGRFGGRGRIPIEGLPYVLQQATMLIAIRRLCNGEVGARTRQNLPQYADCVVPSALALDGLSEFADQRE